VAVGWDEMRQRLLDRVFYNFTEEQVDASTDFVADGLLDSLSVLVILGLFDDELGEGLATGQARVPDTQSMESLKLFYLRLLEDENLAAR
jgi:acyl carrier protein